HATAQVTPVPGFEDVDDVILLETGGETVALVSPHSVRTLGLSSQADFTNENTLPLGGYLSGTVAGEPMDRIYFFSSGFEHVNTAQTLDILSTNNQGHLIFGALAPEHQVSGFTASQETFINQIDLTWAAIPGAEGYLLFREDLGFTRPLASIAGNQQTAYTDHGLTVDHTYTYYILAYNLAEGNLFLSTASTATGKTKPFGFVASSDNEARVTFNYEFDNHLLVGLENQAAYIEVLDITNGGNTPVYGDELTLTDIAESALLFDNSLVLQAGNNDGGSAKPDLGVLPTWTMEAWVNPEVNGTSHVVMDGENILLNLLRDGRLFLNVNGTHYRSEAHPVLWEDWNHVALTYTGSELRMFHNGEPIAFDRHNDKNFELAKAIPNGGLTDNLQFGRLENFNPNSSLKGLNGALGMIRMWNKARTPDQIAADYKDIYDRPANGLLAQWTFDEEVLSLADDIHGRTLTINTTDDAAFPIRWNPSFAFVNPEVNKSVSVWLDQPLPTGTERQYQITMYETGTGRTISSKTDAHTFTHPGAPEVAAAVTTGSPYAIDLTITPNSRHADKYLIRRHEGEEVTTVGTVFPEKTGDTYSLDLLTLTDAFAYQSATSIAGGEAYTWSAIPVYSALERAFQDEDHRGVLAEALPTLDYLTQVQPLANGQGISLTWDAAVLTSVGYDTVQIERDGELLATLSAAQGAYTDTLMLFGQDFTYGVLPLKNGAPALA
ncbi:MAG: LamG-like jellyroll fold domain-containing protein, partial [Bacteroidota bacterium]